MYVKNRLPIHKHKSPWKTETLVKEWVYVEVCLVWLRSCPVKPARRTFILTSSLRKVSWQQMCRLLEDTNRKVTNMMGPLCMKNSSYRRVRQLCRSPVIIKWLIVDLWSTRIGWGDIGRPGRRHCRCWNGELETRSTKAASSRQRTESAPKRKRSLCFERCQFFNARKSGLYSKDVLEHSERKASKVFIYALNLGMHDSCISCTNTNFDRSDAEFNPRKGPRSVWVEMPTAG